MARFGAPQPKIPQASRAAQAVRKPRGERTWDSARARYWPLLAALVILASVLPYWRSLGYDFVWDDIAIVDAKLDVRGPSDLSRIWNTPFDSFLGAPMRQPNYFRPVVLLTLASDRALSGNSPAGYHLTNVAWYAIVCVFLWLFAWEVSGRPLAAAAGAVIFALHPTHPESVAFISGRTDLIAGGFLFASLWAAARWGPRIKRVVLKLAPASLLLLLALYSKEVAFFASPLLLLVLWVRDRRLRARDLLPAAIPILLAQGIYWACRISVLGAHTVPAASPVEGTVSQILTSVAVLARYIPLLLFPVSLSASHQITVLRSPDAIFFAGLLTLILIAVGLVALVRRRSRWSIPLSLFASTLIPLCYVKLLTGFVAERFLFIPSGALALGISLLPGAIPYFAAGIAAPILLLLLSPRVSIWKDEDALYASMLRDSPNSPHVHAMLGGYYYRHRDLARAAEHQRRAFELMPQYTESLLDLSAAEDEMGLADSAFAHVRLLIRLRPRYAPAWYALGNYYVRADRPDSARQAYEESIRLDPGFAQAENNLGVVVERLGRTEEAIAHYRRAVEILPGYAEATNNLVRLTGGRPR
jgi:tetratricopeptide (TPR) repeat protein